MTTTYEDEEGDTLDQPASLAPEVVPPDHAPGSVPTIETPGPSGVTVADSQEPGMASSAWPMAMADIDNPASEAPAPSENQ